MSKKEETQAMIDGVRPDQYMAIGRLHQIGYTFEFLKKNCTEAVDFFSAYEEDDHVPFMAAVQESLDGIEILEDAIADIKTILRWMRAKRSEIFNNEDDE